MKGKDMFLIGIVAGIVLLVVVAFAVTLARPEPTYRVENSPEDVVHNYLLALEKQDYARAYGYLLPTLKDCPDSADEFTSDVMDASWAFRLDVDTTLAVESSVVTGDRAVVKVRESRFDGGGLFGERPSTSVFEMRLRRWEGAWKIEQSRLYFAWQWEK